MSGAPWPVVRLREIADSIEYGVTASARDVPVGPRFLRITDIQNGIVDWPTVPWCECSSRKVESARLWSGDIVFARTGATTGKSYLVEECPADAVFASYLIRVRLGRLAVPRFIARWFNSPGYWSQISRGARGAAQPGVNATSLGNLRVPLPPRGEQRRIAAILDSADRVRAKRRESLALLDSFTESIFLDMFGDPLTNPMGWPESCRLGEIAYIASGITKGRRLNGQATRPVPYLAVANVQDRSLRMNAVKRIEATETEIERYRLRPGDLLLTEGGDPDKLGRGTIWAGELPECIHQNHVFRVRIHDQSMVPLFVSRQIASERGRRYFLRSAKQTTGIASINKSQLAAFPLVQPPLDVQREFTRRLDSSSFQAGVSQRHADQLDELFAALQHRAFRGEL